MKQQVVCWDWPNVCCMWEVRSSSIEAALHEYSWNVCTWPGVEYRINSYGLTFEEYAYHWTWPYVVRGHGLCLIWLDVKWEGWNLRTSIVAVWDTLDLWSYATWCRLWKLGLKWNYNSVHRTRHVVLCDVVSIASPWMAFCSQVKC